MYLTNEIKKKFIFEKKTITEFRKLQKRTEQKKLRKFGLFLTDELFENDCSKVPWTAPRTLGAHLFKQQKKESFFEQKKKKTAMNRLRVGQVRTTVRTTFFFLLFREV